MELRPPTDDELRTYAARHFLELTDEELAAFSDLIADAVPLVEGIDELPEPDVPGPTTERDPGRRPTSGEDPHNAFITFCDVRESTDGSLAGYDVGVKDNVSVADVEMTCGSDLMAGYVPSTDATVVRRLLDEGARIVGKNNMENMASSGSGELSAFGPASNPRDPNYLAGGSSSGSAAAVVAGDVDVAIGTDQGGSVRIPASWCGCVGLKPTFGLVPYSGAVGLGYTFDHVGPLAGTVEDCARTLAVIAGEDPLDPRQRGVGSRSHSGPLEESDPSDWTVGVLEEGFETDSEAARETDGDVAGAVRRALQEFSEEGAGLESTSIEWHTHAGTVRRPISLGETTALIRGNGLGRFVGGWYDTEFLRAFAEARRTAANDFPPTLKLTVLLGEYLDDAYFGYHHAKAQNLRRRLTAAYDDALSDVDVLALPTTTNTAHELEDGLTVREKLERARNSSGNTAAFNLTGHPAITVPCNAVHGLPTGLMFVGNRFEDRTVLEVAAAFEEVVDWSSM